MTSKIDFKKEWKDLYSPSSKQFNLVEIPKMQFLMIDGQGDPNTAISYQEAVEALYAVAFKLKFHSKKELERDYVVPPLEGLWGSEQMVALFEGAQDVEDWVNRFAASDRDTWTWSMMIMQPEWISEEDYQSIKEQVQRMKDLPGIAKMRLETYEEGLSAQTLHLGPYAEEAPTLARLHVEFLPENGLVENGQHHEIYLSDPRKVAPEKLKTILRQPVKVA
jgi:hypothetical protein